MVEVGGKPILWHIMKHFSQHGFHEFVIALGYKGEYIKRFFVDLFALQGAITVDGATGHVRRHPGGREDWRVHLVDTGSSTNTGGRIRRLRGMLGDEPFLVTYGDGVSDVDPNQVVAFHRAHKPLATVTAVRPPARYGGLFFEGPLVTRFTEKPQAGEGWINGGYLVLEPAAVELIKGDDTSLEAEVLEEIAAKRGLAAYKHDGFWQCMDTIRDKRFLESLWTTGKAPWQNWEAA